jgi:hypothetical protein
MNTDLDHHARLHYRHGQLHNAVDTHSRPRPFSTIMKPLVIYTTQNGPRNETFCKVCHSGP